MGNIPARYDIEGLAKELEIDLEMISGLYASYFEEMKSEVDEMKKCSGKSEWMMLERVIHNIKGVSANLRIDDVFSEADEFDIRLKCKNIENADMYIDKITHLIDNAEKDIKLFFIQNGLEI